MDERRGQRRFAMKIPIAVEVGESRHLAGVTRDLNSKGVFFYVASHFNPLSKIEFTLTLPAEVTLAEPMRVLCQGTVLRVEQTGGDKIGLAARIDSFSFEGRERAAG